MNCVHFRVLLYTCRELVLIVKPRNLNRINPAPASPSVSKLNDPGHMLRESLTMLKESLVNGRSLLHFDVRMCVGWGCLCLDS